MDNDNRTINNISLMKPSNKYGNGLFAEAHIGGGMFFYSSSELNNNISEFAIPLVGKLRFKTGEKFSIGIRFSCIFNSFNNLSSIGLSLQWIN